MSTAIIPAASFGQPTLGAAHSNPVRRGNVGISVVRTSVVRSGAVRSSASTRLRLTRRGRAVLSFLVALPLALVLAFTVLNGGVASAARDDASAPVASFATLVVAPGESLWAIASEIAPAADPRDVVDAIVRLNALPSGEVLAGQSIAIPAQYVPSK